MRGHVSEAVAHAQAAFGQATTLVNNAGSAGAMGMFLADSDPLMRRDTPLANVYGPCLFARSVPPAMPAAKRGRIIITVAGRAGTAGRHRGGRLRGGQDGGGTAERESRRRDAGHRGGGPQPASRRRGQRTRGGGDRTGGGAPGPAPGSTGGGGADGRRPGSQGANTTGCPAPTSTSTTIRPTEARSPKRGWVLRVLDLPDDRHARPSHRVIDCCRGGVPLSLWSRWMGLF
ncbi:SDR family NAD(P)-dependent oxidoreductase [Streptomyces sp. R08]|uniref:SDR family NAD(P)-dependent oxidoreductase n=1 Tax=Streptomyces sp. R08 TaxID=3238624 RepID=A0AB39MMP3_9ACTN